MSSLYSIHICLFYFTIWIIITNVMWLLIIFRKEDVNVSQVQYWNFVVIVTHACICTCPFWHNLLYDIISWLLKIISYCIKLSQRGKKRSRFSELMISTKWIFFKILFMIFRFKIQQTKEVELSSFKRDAIMKSKIRE